MGNRQPKLSETRNKHDAVSIDETKYVIVLFASFSHFLEIDINSYWRWCIWENLLANSSGILESVNMLGIMFNFSSAYPFFWS